LPILTGVSIEREMKVPVAGLDPLRTALAGLGARRVEPATFEDNLVLDDAAGTLAASGRLLRLRRWGATVTLTYKGPATFADGVKHRQELETTVSDLEATLAILAKLGFSPVRRYQKRRELWHADTVHVALDETPIGCFVELEGDEAALRDLARRLALDPARAAHGTYLDLWNEWRARHPEAGPDMVFP
jgi:adenylate cyclase class 2